MFLARVLEFLNLFSFLSTGFLYCIAIFPHINWLPDFRFGLLSANVEIVVKTSYKTLSDVLWVPEISTKIF